VELSGPFVITGVAVIMPFNTGSMTASRIATIMNDMIAAMITWANAFSVHAFTNLNFSIRLMVVYTLD